MLIHGHTPNPVITGSSVHNQRIERLWRDTYRCVISLYYQIFYYLEDQGLLEPTCDLDLFCLHLVYQERINSSLKAFVNGWNNHAVTTERNMTPIQLLTCGYLFTSNLETQPFDEHNCAINLDVNSVNVPCINQPHLTLSQTNEILSIITRTSDIGDYGIETYKAIKATVEDFIR